MLTCTELNVSADDFPDRVGSHASVDRVVYVLPVGGGVEREQDQSAVPEDSPDGCDVAHNGSVRGYPLRVRERISRGGAVYPDPTRVRELHFALRFHQKGRPFEMVLEATSQLDAEPCESRKNVFIFRRL